MIMNIRNQIRQAVNTAEVSRDDPTTRYFEIRVFVPSEKHVLDRATMLELKSDLQIEIGGIASITYLMGDSGYEVVLRDIEAHVTEIKLGNRTIRGAW